MDESPFDYHPDELEQQIEQFLTHMESDTLLPMKEQQQVLQALETAGADIQSELKSLQQGGTGSDMAPVISNLEIFFVEFWGMLTELKHTLPREHDAFIHITTVLFRELCRTWDILLSIQIQKRMDRFYT